MFSQILFRTFDFFCYFRHLFSVFLSFRPFLKIKVRVINRFLLERHQAQRERSVATDSQALDCGGP